MKKRKNASKEDEGMKLDAKALRALTPEDSYNNSGVFYIDTTLCALASVPKSHFLHGLRWLVRQEAWAVYWRQFERRYGERYVFTIEEILQTLGTVIKGPDLHISICTPLP